MRNESPLKENANRRQQSKYTQMKYVQYRWKNKENQNVKTMQQE